MNQLLITGAGGFIGSNCVRRFSDDWNITGLDNCERENSKDNLKALEGKMEFVLGNIVSGSALLNAIKGGQPKAILHLAAQVAVTSSIDDPYKDFKWNAQGTFNVLEYARMYAPDAVIVYASTNKVHRAPRYRELDSKYEMEYSPHNTPYVFEPVTPYGASKGVGDMYMREYAATYGLDTCVFRQSCVYGGMQDTTMQDQGWVAYMAGCIVRNEEFTIYGDGKQVRDLLWIDDLVELYSRAMQGGNDGAAYSVGGGMENAKSVLQVVSHLEKLANKTARFRFADWRPHDQRVYVADNTEVMKRFDWEPKVYAVDGLERLVETIRR